MNPNSNPLSRFSSTSPLKSNFKQYRPSESRIFFSDASRSKLKSSTKLLHSSNPSKDFRNISSFLERSITPEQHLLSSNYSKMPNKLKRVRKVPSMFNIYKRPSILEESKRNTSSEFFPAWLMSRADFKDTITQLNQIDGVRIGRICSKPARDRSNLEKRCIERWMSSVPFFANMGNQKVKEMMRVLNTEIFEEGQYIVRQGEDADCLFIILKGTVGIFFNEGTEAAAFVKPVNIIGEYSLEKGNKRIATAKAMTSVVTIKLMAIDYENVALKTKLDRKTEMAKFIKTIEFFSEWPYSKILSLVNNMFIMTYKRGAEIYKVGDDAIQFYLVYKGAVSLEVEIPIQSTFMWPKEKHKWELTTNKKTFKNQLKLYKSGDFFGEREILMNIKRDCRAVVMQDFTVLYILNKEYMLEILHSREKEYLIHRKGCPPGVDQMVHIVKNRLKEENLKLKHLLDAVNFNVQQDGRDYFYSSKLKKKQIIAADLYKRYRRNVSKGLLNEQDESTTVEKQSAINIAVCI